MRNAKKLLFAPDRAPALTASSRNSSERTLPSPVAAHAVAHAFRSTGSSDALEVLLRSDLPARRRSTTHLQYMANRSMMALAQYRASSSEQQRTADLLRLMPATGRHALDIGARDGHFSLLMAERFGCVTALDLTQPHISHPKVLCVEGDAAEMQFPDGSFDFVFCAEVLEHIPAPILPKVCEEIQRVAGAQILIGVPYKQDIRVGRTTCYSCGKPNPPWGHVNSFDEERIKTLFAGCKVESVSFVGVTTLQTNSLTTALLDFAGNPFGTYDQGEPCVHCGQRLLPPPQRTPAQFVATKLAALSNKVTDILAKPRGNWMHVVLRKG